MTIRNIQEAETALLDYVPLVAHPASHGTPLEHVKSLMQVLGNPQDRLRVIHIAGTSGKTSTAYYMSALLTAIGKKVGLAVSPHVDSVTERVQLNGQPLSEADFCAELSSFLDIVQAANHQPSYFVLLYAFALWVFERRGVDYAVIETGMGGLFDATNVANRPDKVCIITDIGFDHRHLLGNTLAAIAAQKIGIVHPGNTVFTYPQTAEVMDVFVLWIEKQQATLHVVDESVKPKANKMPGYQWRNWCLAYSTYQYLQSRDSVPHLTRQVLRKTQKLQIPARMDVSQIAGKTLVMDGAHNAQKMTAFADSFRQLFPGVKPAILVALKNGKEHQEVAPLLATLGSRIITTSFNTTQDLPAVSIDPDVLAESFRAAGAVDVESNKDQVAAYQALLKGPETVCVITGSFYLLSQLRKAQRIT